MSRETPLAAVQFGTRDARSAAAGRRRTISEDAMPDWPNRAHSRFVETSGLRWHVQIMGQGPVALLLHGTGAATHSWRDLAPLLAARFTVVAPDLPGHGFSGLLKRPSLPGFSAAVGDLLSTLRMQPEIAVGHSAGAAIAARMSLDQVISPSQIVSLNGALLPLKGFAGLMFAPMAKFMSLNPFVPRLFAWGASDRDSVARLIRDTGSVLDTRGTELYARLLQRPAHVEGALQMMANWDLDSLARDLPRLAPLLTLIVGARDRAVAPADAEIVSSRVPNASIVRLPGLGHLAHEENPARIAELIIAAAEAGGALPRDARC